MLRTFIQVLALVTTLGSAIFLAKGSFGLSAQDIAALGGTYWGHNLHLIRSLTQQTADYRAGVILLVLAFTLQMANTLWPMRWMDFDVSGRGAVLAVATGIVLFVVAWWLANLHASKLEKQVRVIYERAEQKAPTQP